MLLKPAVLVCLLAELGLARQVRRQDNVAPSPILSSINIPPPLSTGTGAVAPISGGPTGIFLNTSVPATAPQLSTVTEVATITSTLSNNVTTTEVITTERTVTASAAPVIQQPQVIIISQVTFFTFISALGGAPPAVQQGDQGGFVVGGQQFGQFQSACNAACGMQFTQCQSIAGQNFQISQCQTQLIACQNAAKTATVTVSVPTTVTQTVLLPNGPISGDAGGVPSGIAEEGGSVITTTTLPPDAGATVGTGGVSFITVTATPGAPPSQTAVPETDVLTTTLPANPDQPDATPVVSVITVTRQPGSEPSQPVEGGASGQGGSVVTSAVVSTLPPQSEGGQPIVSTVYVTATVSGGVPAASEVVSSADAVASSSAVVTTLPAQSEGGEPIVSTIYVSAPPPAPTNEPGASEQAGSVVTSAVVSTLPAESGLPPVVSTIYVTATVSGGVPIASEAVSSVDAIASSSAVVTTLPAQSEGGEPVVSTVFVSVPPAAPTDEPGASEQGSVVTSAIETTLPAQSEGGSAIVSTVYVTATVPASGPAASEVVSRPAQQPPNPNEPKTSVITMTLAPPSGTPVYSLVTITIQPTAGPSGTAPVQTELSTSALTSTIPAEGTTPPRVTTVYITAQPPVPTSAPPPRVITVTVGSLTGVVTVSDAQSTASATTVASALPSAVTGGGNGGNGGDGGNGGNGGSDNGGNNSGNGGGGGNGGGVGQEGSGSCPSAVTVTETVSACPTAPVTSVLTQTVSVVPTAAAAAKRAEKPAAADEVKRDAVRHPRRHGHAFGLW
ncbi:hypothetical protein CH63R_08846 [Colletotrichum higginsianum IMI 349063]|uniref:Uncharacterized protein n=1 Tax=Colletotrichum higginsianum (strain IMI 349063) TaxID=759273 RepID=A0A1B7Y5V5_COLHI|nr:hypothetical protein CH63R_08846 [Colletotrichum higginsianum IMI 349063]OBR07325.1 hypothetical protein CH63R_08846 [Colletotrichum higginsianum IMI 349063]